MMTYGMTSNNGYYQNALYKSTVFDSPAELAGKTLNSCSIEESIVIYQNYGIPNNKIIVGVAFYGIRQTRTYNASTGSWSSWSNDGSVSFSYITNFYLTSEDWEYHYDSAAGVPYLLHKDGDVFVSYDNPRSIADKSAFILEQGLAGMMYWENGHDSTGTLLLAMDTNLND
jgi:chitinase